MKWDIEDIIGPTLLVAVIWIGGYLIYNREKMYEKRHRELPEIIQPYDTNRDGCLRGRELEEFFRDYELKHK